MSLINISNKSCQCPNTDYWVDDALGLIVHQQTHRASNSNRNVVIKFIAHDTFLE